MPTPTFDQPFARLPTACFSAVTPYLRGEPYLIAASGPLQRDLGIDDDLNWCDVLRGAPLPGMQPIATVYAGHQFGHFVPQLGDGRAVLLGEQRTADGRRMEWQLKGSGRTPYSRFGDGFAVLRSSIREFLVSEAMAALGIATTRALALVGSDAPIQRETIETGAVVLRIAPTFVRFGHFEYFAARNQTDVLRAIADFVVDGHLPTARTDADTPAEVYGRLYRHAVEQTAAMVAAWQAVGFVHGVMNTDNMSILGLTVDYGPYAFLDEFQADAVFNHSDEGGRYAYNQQPRVAHWNLACLGRALVGLVEPAALQTELDRFPALYQEAWLAQQRQKFGWQQARDDDGVLADDWLQWLAEYRRDYTQSYRQLAHIPVADDAPLAAELGDELAGELAAEQGHFNRDLLADLQASELGRHWLRRYRERLAWETSDSRIRVPAMNGINPLYIPRTHLLQTAIELATQKDFSEVNRLMRLWERPFTAQTGREADGRSPEQAAPVVLSCSS